MKKYIPFVLLLLAGGLLSVQWIWLPSDSNVQKQRFSERVNLALRQTGDRLLKIAGDSVSTIEPVQKLGGDEFVLRLESKFNYDTLPYILAEALSDFEIAEKYRVMVRNCESDDLVLGYNLLSYQELNVPCGGRKNDLECNKISVVFEERSAVGTGNNLSRWALGLVGLSLMLQFRVMRREKTIAIEKQTPDNPDFVKIGSSSFDFKNQSAIVNGQKKSLTFRENKLLKYFLEHRNNVLEREQLLSNVWGDEGVIVGRSLDVFVSRLRKILKEDENFKLKNVHGVGYRLEVKEQ